MSKKESTTSILQLKFIGKDGIDKSININELTKIKANSGDKFQVIKTKKGENQIVDNFIAMKDADTLELMFASGESLCIKNFYTYNNVEIKFTVSDSYNSIYTLSSQSTGEKEVADGTTIVYVRGK